jgi:ribosomal protein L37AE/L43A
MKKNKVQFQKGLSEEAFRARYGTEEQCRAELFSWRWPEGFICPVCQGTVYVEIKHRKLYQCRHCRHQASLIAGTIFHSTKLPLTTWFAAMYHLTQSKKGILLRCPAGPASNWAVVSGCPRIRPGNLSTS